jgi:hypothetical protein
MSDPKLNPGSNGAIQAGCKCARVDNHYGLGFIVNGQTHFVVSGDCPLHNRVDGHGNPDRMQCRNE